MSPHPLAAEEPAPPPPPPPPPRLPYHPQSPFRAAEADEAPFFFPSGGRRATRLSITDLRVMGEDAAVSMESGCVDTVSGGGGQPVK